MKETESDWKTYMGSSKWLTADIEKIGKEHFKFEIIAEYKNRRSLRYYELYYQMKFNVLSSIFEGTDEPAYYNSRVGGKFYRPVESYQDPEYRKNLKKVWSDPELRKKQSENQKKYFSDPEARKKTSEALKNSEAHKKAVRDPKFKKKQAEIMKKRPRDPVTGRILKQNVQAK